MKVSVDISAEYKEPYADIKIHTDQSVLYEQC